MRLATARVVDGLWGTGGIDRIAVTFV